jgi:hypothetical protein
MNEHGVRISVEQPGSEIDAQALAGGPVFDVIGANTSLVGLVLRNCPAATVQLRASISSCSRALLYPAMSALMWRQRQRRAHRAEPLRERSHWRALRRAEPQQ